MEQQGERDDRITAYRCLTCNRLRAQPVDMATFLCACGSARFSPTNVLPDEEQIALRLYSRQIEERNLWKHL